MASNSTRLLFQDLTVAEARAIHDELKDCSDQERQFISTRLGHTVEQISALDKFVEYAFPFPPEQDPENLKTACYEKERGEIQSGMLARATIGLNDPDADAADQAYLAQMDAYLKKNSITTQPSLETEGSDSEDSDDAAPDVGLDSELPVVVNTIPEITMRPTENVEEDPFTSPSEAVTTEDPFLSPTELTEEENRKRDATSSPRPTQALYIDTTSSEMLGEPATEPSFIDLVNPNDEVEESGPSGNRAVPFNSPIPISSDGSVGPPITIATNSSGTTFSSPHDEIPARDALKRDRSESRSPERPKSAVRLGGEVGQPEEDEDTIQNINVPVESGNLNTSELPAETEEAEQQQQRLAEANEALNVIGLNQTEIQRQQERNTPSSSSNLDMICFPLQLAFVITYCTRVHPRNITHAPFWESMAILTNGLYPTQDLGIEVASYDTFCAYFQQKSEMLRSQVSELEVFTNGDPAQPKLLKNNDNRRLTLLCTAILYGCMKGTRRGMPANIKTKAVSNAQYNPYSSTETFDDMFYKDIVDTMSSNSLTHADSFNTKGANRLQALREADCPRFIEIISFSNGIWRYVNARTTNEATNQQLKWSEFLDEASPVDAVDRPWLFAYYLLTTLNIVELRDAIQAIGRNTQRVPGGSTRQVMDTIALSRGAGAKKQTRYQSTYR